MTPRGTFPLVTSRNPSRVRSRSRLDPRRDPKIFPTHGHLTLTEVRLATQKRSITHLAFSTLPSRANRGASRIGQYVTIGANSSISSSIVEDNVLIGARSVLEPGSYVEENAALQAGTRVEAGALIPGGQLWGGNPARYVRDLDGHEIAEIRSIAEQTYGAATDHAAQSTPWGNAYVQTEALRKALAKTE